MKFIGVAPGAQGDPERVMVKVRQKGAVPLFLLGNKFPQAKTLGKDNYDFWDHGLISG